MCPHVLGGWAPSVNETHVASFLELPFQQGGREIKNNTHINKLRNRSDYKKCFGGK